MLAFTFVFTKFTTVDTNGAPVSALLLPRIASVDLFARRSRWVARL